MKDLNETNLRYISTMSSEDQHQWYLRIKESLPTLRRVFSAEDIKEIETEIENYELRWME